jgi:hypothetical protein
MSYKAQQDHVAGSKKQVASPFTIFARLEVAGNLEQTTTARNHKSDTDP